MAKKSIVKYVDAAHRAAAAGKLADSTVRAYAGDLEDWRRFAQQHDVEEFPIPPAVLAAYIMYMDSRGLKLTTIRRRCSALSQWHQEQGHPSPVNTEIRAVFRGVETLYGDRLDQKRGLMLDLLNRVLQENMSARDRAIFLVGFWTGMRGSELAMLRWEDLQECEEGIVVHVRASKGVRSRAGQTKGLVKMSDLNLCPVEALNKLRWQRKNSGPDDLVFGCCGRTITRVVKRYLKRIGEDETHFGSISFRRGFVTEALRSGASVFDTMAQTGHKTVKGVQCYVEKPEVLGNPALMALVLRLSD